MYMAKDAIKNTLAQTEKTISQASTEDYSITSTIRCVVIGKICFVSGEIKCLNPRADQPTIIATGLPANLLPADLYANAWGANAGSKQPLSLNIPITNTDTAVLRVAYGEANSFYPFSLLYPIK